MLAVLRFKWDGMKFGKWNKLVVDYLESVLIFNMIVYHLFLIWEPHRISFDFVTA